MKQEAVFHFYIQITARELWGFSMYHSNKGYLGIFNLLFTLAALWLLVTKWGNFTIPYRLLLIVCALMFTVWQPFLLYLKARKQAKGKMVKEPMEMTLSKNGFVIEQNGEKQEILWEQVGSVEHMKGQLIIYMSRIRAYLIPDRAIGDQKEAFFVLLREVIPKERRKRV